MNFLLQKSVRTAVLYVLGCGLCLAVSRAQRLSLCTDWRFAALRELQHVPGPGDGAPAPSREAADAEAAGADVLFLGSSVTARGVRPLVVEDELRALGARVPRLLNLAVMGEPRHVNFLQLESYLRDHPAPRIVCVEVGKVDLPDRPHPTVAGFMGPVDALRVALEAPYLYRDPAAEGRAVQRGAPEGLDAWIAALDRRGFHLELALQAVGRGPEDLVRVAYNRARNAVSGQSADGRLPRLAGWRNPYWADDPPIELGALASQVERRGWYRIDPDTESYAVGLQRVRDKADRVTTEHAIEERLPVDLSDPGHHRFVRVYTRRLAELCERNGIRLVFLHLPGFRERNLSADQVELYERLGSLYRPDLAALYIVENYADPGHLTARGAEHYSRELARYLAGLESP